MSKAFYNNSTTTKNKSGQYQYHYDRLTIQDHLNVLSNDYERKSNGSYLCRCPLKHNHPHEDETKSLVISEGRDRSVVYYCLSHGGNGNNMHFNDGACTQKKLAAKFHTLLRENGTLDKKCKVYHAGPGEYPDIKLNAVTLNGEQMIPKRDRVVNVSDSFRKKITKSKILSESVRNQVEEELVETNDDLVTAATHAAILLMNGWPRKLSLTILANALKDQKQNVKRIEQLLKEGGTNGVYSPIS